MAPEAMLSTAARAWPAGGDWVLSPKWDGWRVLLEVAARGRVRAWSRHGTSFTERLTTLTSSFAGLPQGTVIDGELVAITERDGQPVQDFAAVSRAVFAGRPDALKQLRYVAFDLLAVGTEDLRPQAWRDRDERLREMLPVDDQIRLVATLPATEAAHDELVALGFEGSVLKRRGSTYRPGRSRAWLKHKARHEVHGRLERVYQDHDGGWHGVLEVEGRLVHAITGADAHRHIGRKLSVVHSRVDADGGLREARIKLP